MTAYVISNSPLNKLYPNVQIEKPATWKAFVRRFHHLYHMDGDGLHELDIAEHVGLTIVTQPPKFVPPKPPAQIKLADMFSELPDDDGELPF